MEPICYQMNKELSLTILPECRKNEDSYTCTFQLFYGSPTGKDSLNDLNNYAGLLSFNWASQEFYYTQGNLALSNSHLLRVIECIKTHIY